MHKKNLTTQANDFANRITGQNLPIELELAELSEEALSQVCGGTVEYAVPWEPDPCCTCVWFPPDELPYLEGEPSILII